MKTEDIVKWAVTVTQLIGYGMTGLNYRPYNVYMFSLVFCRWGRVDGQSRNGSPRWDIYINISGIFEHITTIHLLRLVRSVN